MVHSSFHASADVLLLLSDFWGITLEWIGFLMKMEWEGGKEYPASQKETARACTAKSDDGWQFQEI
jgi:hypothetical protein